VAVYCRQIADGEEQEWVIAPHADDQTDAELLRVKADGAAAKGWEVEWTSPTTFVAKKVRWQHEAVCVRYFRTG
jgi:hypothetical protein